MLGGCIHELAFETCVLDNHYFKIANPMLDLRSVHVLENTCLACLASSAWFRSVRHCCLDLVNSAEHLSYVPCIDRNYVLRSPFPLLRTTTSAMSCSSSSTSLASVICHCCHSCSRSSFRLPTWFTYCYWYRSPFGLTCQRSQPRRAVYIYTYSNKIQKK